MHGRRGQHDGMGRRPADRHRRADRRQRHRRASRRRHSRRPVPARAHRQGPAGRGRDDRLGAQSVPGQDARPAAPRRSGPLPEYPNEEFGDAVPRAGNASGGGQPGSALRCAPGGPNDYVYVIIQPPSWAPLMKHRRPRGIDRRPALRDPRGAAVAHPGLLLDHREMDDDQDQVRGHGRAERVRRPCGPILSMKDIYEDRELYERGMLVEIDHPERGRYVQVGMPIKLSDSPAEVKRSPLLGEHTDEVLGWLGYGDGRHQEAARRRRGLGRYVGRSVRTLSLYPRGRGRGEGANVGPLLPSPVPRWRVGLALPHAGEGLSRSNMRSPPASRPPHPSRRRPAARPDDAEGTAGRSGGARRGAGAARRPAAAPRPADRASASAPGPVSAACTRGIWRRWPRRCGWRWPRSTRSPRSMPISTS